MIAAPMIEKSVLSQAVVTSKDGSASMTSQLEQKFRDAMWAASQEPSELTGWKKIIPKEPAPDSSGTQVVNILGSTNDQRAVVPPPALPSPPMRQGQSQSAGQLNVIQATSPIGSGSTDNSVSSESDPTQINSSKGLNVTEKIKIVAGAGQSSKDGPKGTNDQSPSVPALILPTPLMLTVQNQSNGQPIVVRAASLIESVSAGNSVLSQAAPGQINWPKGLDTTDQQSSGVAAIGQPSKDEALATSPTKVSTTDTADISASREVFGSLLGRSVAGLSNPSTPYPNIPNVYPGISQMSNAATKPETELTTQTDQSTGELVGTNISTNMIANPAITGEHSVVTGIGNKERAKVEAQAVSATEVTDPKERGVSGSNSESFQTKDPVATKSEIAAQGSKSGEDQSILTTQVVSVEHVGSQDTHVQAVEITPSIAQPKATQVDAASHIHEAAIRADGEVATSPYSVAAINTAKVIQSMGQTEMRVGMNSTEFGNISIRTSATRDLIIAQISLDHGDLAKELAVHLPEIQEKLGSVASASVRIDLAGTLIGQGSGTPGGMSNGTTNNSGANRQQQNNNTANAFGGNIQSWPVGNAKAVSVTTEGVLNERLDIRI